MMLTDIPVTFDECTQWLAEREDAIAELLGDLTSAQWRGEDRHEQICTATRNVMIVRDIQRRLQATTAPLTPTGEAALAQPASAPTGVAELAELVAQWRARAVRSQTKNALESGYCQAMEKCARDLDSALAALGGDDG